MKVTWMLEAIIGNLFCRAVSGQGGGAPTPVQPTAPAPTCSDPTRSSQPGCYDSKPPTTVPVPTQPPVVVPPAPGQCVEVPNRSKEWPTCYVSYESWECADHFGCTYEGETVCTSVGCNYVEGCTFASHYKKCEEINRKSFCTSEKAQGYCQWEVLDLNNDGSSSNDGSGSNGGGGAFSGTSKNFRFLAHSALLLGGALISFLSVLLWA